jgi:osmotically-inducible protein OsmY
VTAIRQAEAIAASVQGVLGVENALDTGAIGGSRVVAALTKDSQADIALVEVSDEEGVLTLEGQVGSQEIRETLEEVAEERTDVHTVISELEVKPDEGSTL